MKCSLCKVETSHFGWIVLCKCHDVVACCERQAEQKLAAEVEIGKILDTVAEGWEDMDRNATVAEIIRIARGE